MSALALVPAVAADAGGTGRGDVRLYGRAVLPVETYAPGPMAGVFFVPSGQSTGEMNGITFPTIGQPVEGFSGIVEGRRSGEWLAMTDNGFGNKANSFDFRIRAYFLTPDFRTARGGSGDVSVNRYIEFSDPNRVIGFPIVNGATDRVLTGADIDPESLQRGSNGDLWVGDEFGPWILHFDGGGRLLEAPIALPGVTSPSNPLPPGPATVRNSRGIEGMAISPDGWSLYVVLEGALDADLPTAPLSRKVYRIDTRTHVVTAIGTYKVEADGGREHFVADVQMLDRNRLLVVERDGGRGVTATFRRVYEIDLRVVDATGAYVKQQVVDLASIPDPRGVSLPAIHAGDVLLGDPFGVACESIEALRIVSDSRLLLGCDNNFPNSGRNPGLADDNELILVDIPRR
ncbi:MAG: esterase-like activity of phytase family protein [Ilumatobacteraceae bacterium]